jgi:hypothetical protein
VAPPVFKSPSACYGRQLRVRWLAKLATFLPPTLPCVTLMKSGVGTQWAVRLESEVGQVQPKTTKSRLIQIGNSGRSGLEILCVGRKKRVDSAFTEASSRGEPGQIRCNTSFSLLSDYARRGIF